MILDVAVYYTPVIITMIACVKYKHILDKHCVCLNLSFKFFLSNQKTTDLLLSVSVPLFLSHASLFYLFIALFLGLLPYILSVPMRSTRTNSSKFTASQFLDVFKIFAQMIDWYHSCTHSHAHKTTSTVLRA